MGASDATAAMVDGEVWLRVPGTVWLEVEGTPSAAARPRDVAIHVLGTLGQEPFLYRSVEWAGPWAEKLTLDSCATVANLGVDLGAKCTFLPPGKGAQTACGRSGCRRREIRAGTGSTSTTCRRWSRAPLA